MGRCDHVDDDDDVNVHMGSPRDILHVRTSINLTLYRTMIKVNKIFYVPYVVCLKTLFVRTGDDGCD